MSALASAASALAAPTASLVKDIRTTGPEGSSPSSFTNVGGKLFFVATDLTHALRYGRPHRASGALAYHVLDAMHAFLDSSREGRHIELASTCERPAPLPLGLPATRLDD